MFSKEITFVCMCSFACGVVKLEILRLTKAIFPARALFCFYQLSVSTCVCVCVHVCVHVACLLTCFVVVLQIFISCRN